MDETAAPLAANRGPPDSPDMDDQVSTQSTASSARIAAIDVQGVFFETFRISKVLGPTRLNIRPLLTFLVKAERKCQGRGEFVLIE